jgi:hypothetical protein
VRAQLLGASAQLDLEPRGLDDQGSIVSRPLARLPDADLLLDDERDGPGEEHDRENGVHQVILMNRMRSRTERSATAPTMKICGPYLWSRFLERGSG